MDLQKVLEERSALCERTDEDGSLSPEDNKRVDEMANQVMRYLIEHKNTIPTDVALESLSLNWAMLRLFSTMTTVTGLSAATVHRTFPMKASTRRKRLAFMVSGSLSPVAGKERLERLW